MIKVVPCLCFIVLVFGAACNTDESKEKSASDSANYPIMENPPSASKESPVQFAPLDTNAVIKTVEEYVASPVFSKKYYPDGLGTVYTEERPIVYGDINGDKQADILMPFTIEGAGGGNHYEVYYAILLRENNAFKVIDVFERGIKSSDYMVVLDTVDNGAIKGWRKAGFHMARQDSLPVLFQFDSGKLKEITPPAS